MRVVVCLCVCVCFGLLAGAKCRPRHPEKRKTVFSRVVPRLSHVVVSSEVISVALARAAGVHLGQGRVVFSGNHTCMEREGRRLFSPAADYFPKATPAYKDGLPRNSSGRGVNLFFSRNHTSIEREGCRLCFLAADFAPPGRPLLTMMGCRLCPPAADFGRLCPQTQLLHTRDGADRPTPFRSYIILYVNGDGGDRVRTPHCTGAPVPSGWQVSLVWLYFGPV